MSRPSLADKDFLTVIETAEYFGLSRRKLFRLAEEKNKGHYFINANSTTGNNEGTDEAVPEVRA